MNKWITKWLSEKKQMDSTKWCTAKVLKFADDAKLIGKAGTADKVNEIKEDTISNVYCKNLIKS